MNNNIGYNILSSIPVVGVVFGVNESFFNPLYMLLWVPCLIIVAVLFGIFGDDLQAKWQRYISQKRTKYKTKWLGTGQTHSEV